MRTNNNYKSDAEIKVSWDRLISHIDKYFNTPIVQKYDGHRETREFIIPARKDWVFYMLNNVWCNFDIDEYAYVDDYHPRTYKQSRTKASARTSSKQYILCTDRYLHGNTHVVVFIDDVML